MTKSADDAEPTPSEESKKDTDRARQRISEVGERVGKKVGEAARSAGERADAVREVASENLKAGVDRVKTDLDALSDEVQKYVNDNPGRSVLIAAGVGFLVGLLVRGGRR